MCFANINDTKGLTITEFLVSIAILSIVASAAPIGMSIAPRVWDQNQNLSNANWQSQQVFSRISSELRRSGADTVYIHDNGQLDVLSFGKPSLMSDGTVEIESSSSDIVWDKTVIYHTYTNPQAKDANSITEIRRSEVDYGSLSAEQINAYADDPGGASTTVVARGITSFDVYSNDYQYIKIAIVVDETTFSKSSGIQLRNTEEP